MHACDVTGEGCACPYLVWTHKRDLVQEHLVPPAVPLALPQLLHIVPKNRLLECFIMEPLLTATNTFSNDDDRNATIYTCNYNGCHEPQQIDYILSSDHSLRSRTFDSSATSSDHWELTANIRETSGKRQGEKTRHKTDRMGMSRPRWFQQHGACTAERGRWPFWFHGNDEASSTWGQADGGALWTSAKQHG